MKKYRDQRTYLREKNRKDFYSTRVLRRKNVEKIFHLTRVPTGKNRKKLHLVKIHKRGVKIYVHM